MRNNKIIRDNTDKKMLSNLLAQIFADFYRFEGIVKREVSTQDTALDNLEHRL
jgi:hypothetical protein